jgi:hypothetical protein
MLHDSASTKASSFPYESSRTNLLLEVGTNGACKPGGPLEGTADRVGCDGVAEVPSFCPKSTKSLTAEGWGLSWGRRSLPCCEGSALLALNSA